MLRIIPFRFYLVSNPCTLFRVPCLFLSLFITELSLATLCAPSPRSIIAIMKDLSDILANNFHLTSKEDDDIDVGENPFGDSPYGTTYDLVGRVVP